MTTNYNIIACDGGGIRGLMTAMLLNDLVTNPPKGATSNILSNVNLFAGTSTGGIIAVGLAAQLQPSVLVDLYKQDCASIFTKYEHSAIPSRMQLRFPRIAADLDSTFGDGIFDVLYTNVDLQEAVYNTLNTSSYSPDSPLSALSQGILVTTFMISDTSNDPWGAVALTNLPNSPNAATPLITAAMCTSAAPVYFPPYGVPPSPSTASAWFVDGGVFANNPSSFSLANVLQSQVLQQQNKSLSSVRMLSLGTGATTDYIPSGDLSNPFDWGALAWLDPLAKAPEPKMPLLGLTFDGQAQIAAFETGSILGSSQYQRGNPTLAQTVNLDDCSAMSILEQTAENYIASTEWTNIKQWTYDNFI